MFDRMPVCLAHPDQPLLVHLRNVAERARYFGGFFGGEEHAFVAGLLHDLGKAENEFQKRIRSGDREGMKQPHAHHGAALLLEPDPERGGPIWPVAFAINGHHAGLHNRHNLIKRVDMRAKAIAAEKRLSQEANEIGGGWPIAKFGKDLPVWFDRLGETTHKERTAKAHALDLYIRFLFSALVDADRLDTESSDRETRQNFTRRHGWRFGEAGLAGKNAAEELLQQLELAIEQRRVKAHKLGTSAQVLEVRDAVLDRCKSAAMAERGVFTLTVPTGGGKTLASIYFALRHIAKQNVGLAKRFAKLRRIIFVIPYLNIIQQTAQELIDVFQHSPDDPVLLEHHSQARDSTSDRDDGAEASDPDGYSRKRTLRQLAAENWDAPIIVTTSVQFFDSLFSRRPADARKLHNIAQSVIIFDEVQTFPPLLLQSILNVLGALTDRNGPYGCSLLLCTATQPALAKAKKFSFGFEDVTHIIKDPKESFRRLERTSYPELESGNDIPIRSWPQWAAELSRSPNGQGLAIVNTRRHARELFGELQTLQGGRDAIFHLSTSMTPAHRAEVLNEVRRRLNVKEPCFLVSTQCVEAGVDVDFPAVWRALGPYDAIAQAAGRCNRNGTLKDANGERILGQVHVFRPESENLPSGVYNTATSQTEVLRRMGRANPHDPATFEIYFRLLYQLTVPDECEIQQNRAQLRFQEVHDRFNFIESFTVPIIAAEYDLAEEKVELTNLCEQAAKKGFLTPVEWQLLQPHIIHLEYRDQRTARFLPGATAKVFREDEDDLTCLRRLTHFSAYDNGLHGCGLKIEEIGCFESVL